MKRDKKNEYILALIFIFITFFNLFLPNSYVKTYMYIFFVVIYTIICYRIIGIKKQNNENKNKIVILNLALSIIYITILFIIGIFTGFYKNIQNSILKTLLSELIPFLIIVLSTEFIRQLFIIRNNKKLNIIITIGIILAELNLYAENYNVIDLNKLLELIGFVILPIISTNLLCNYIVKKYGILPNIIYRVITNLYLYISPILPNIYMFFQSVYKITYPYLIYLIIDWNFEKNKFKPSIKNKKINIASTTISIIIIMFIVMLVSCKFRFGIIVVGSSSMQGSINMGDAVVFEKYENQQLNEGDVIIFYKDNIRVIHRIKSVQIKNGDEIYYTKGDNNDVQDDNYRTNKDIIGIVKFKILYIGWPTIWINKLFN